MLRNAVAPLFGLCLFAAAPAPAHELVPASWCHGGSRQVLLEVHFTPDDLQRYRDGHVAVDLVTGQPCAPNVKCGIVDDEWHWATQMMNDPLIFDTQRRAGDSAAGDVIAVVMTPDYNDPYHHKRYGFGDGLHVRYLECRFTRNGGN